MAWCHVQKLQEAWSYKTLGQADIHTFQTCNRLSVEVLNLFNFSVFKQFPSICYELIYNLVFFLNSAGIFFSFFKAFHSRLTVVWFGGMRFSQLSHRHSPQLSAIIIAQCSSFKMRLGTRSPLDKNSWRWLLHVVNSIAFGTETTSSVCIPVLFFPSQCHVMVN